MNLDHYFETPKIAGEVCLIEKEHTIAHHLKPFANGKINADVALIGVKEDANSLYNKGCGASPDYVRSHLYQLQGQFKNLYFSDLGNLKKGKGLNDTYFALQDVVRYLIEQQVIPIIIGGSHDLSYPICKAIGEKTQPFNLALADSTVDAMNTDDLHDHSYLRAIEKSLQANISIMGIQAYQSELGHAYECLRLKSIRDDLSAAEPLLRDADFTSMDISITKASDAPGNGYNSPNGLLAEQTCKIAHFAGLSDRVKAFGIFGVNPDLDVNKMTSQLAAQSVWHFIHGLDSRFKDFPLRDFNTYSKKIVHQEDMKREITFYHNIQNNRWWFNAVEKGEAEIISCSFHDYLATQEGKLPDRLMRHLK